MIHVAIMMKRYLDLVLEGTKTVECRLTRQARDPYEAIEPGERIYFKQSAGPYRATALAEHVMFESGLTPRRIKQIQRDYNDLLCGDEGFWRWKRDSLFCTLIWLADVEPTDSGPEIPPLQGRAWLALEEEPAWRRRDGADPSFSITITEGNLRHGSLYVTGVLDRFPDWAIGGRTKRQAARPLQLILHEGPTVETDIVGPRKGLRTRVWRSWFKRHGARAGDCVMFTPVDEGTYFVGLARGGDPVG
jgi:ASC-1-like (ASCH) protein